MTASAAALSVTLLLGASGGMPLPGPDSLLLAGLAAILGLGLAAWHFARLTVLPLAMPLRAALAAALLPAMFAPGMGIGALIPPAILALLLGWTHRDRRSVALMVPCGALASPALAGVNHQMALVAMMALLGITFFQMVRGLSGAANDNPSMERIRGNNGLPVEPPYDRNMTDSIPGKWGVSNVQQKFWPRP